MKHQAKLCGTRKVLGLLVLASLALVANAATAVAAPPTVTIDPSPKPFYTTVEVSGTIDPGENDTFWSFQVSTDEVNWTGFSSEGPAAHDSGLQNISPREIGGLQPGTKYYVRLAALDNVNAFEGSEIFSPGPNPSFTTKPVGPPAVTFGVQPGSVTGTSAHFKGTIDPELDPAADLAHAYPFDATYYLECTPECPEMPYIIIPADSVSHPIEVDANDLLPGTKYEVRLYYFNAGGSYIEGPKTFTTPALKPTVRTGAAHVTTTTANIAGSINPNGAETSYHFEWGPGFANSTPTKSVFAGNTPVSVTANLSGLTPDTTYPFRLVTKNSIGEVNSDDKTFTTQAEVAEECPNDEFRVGPSAALPDCRAYELVNPPGTDWSDIVRVFPAADDGNHITYMTLVPPEIATSSVVVSSYVSARTASGWTTTDANLRVKYVYGLSVSIPQCFSNDYTHVIVSTPASINDDDQDSGGQDLARVAVGNPVGDFISYNENVLPDKQQGIFNYLGGSSDLSQVLFSGYGASIGPETPPGTAIYLRDSSGLRIISRDLNGDILPDGYPVGANCATRNNSGTNGVSADGKKIFYTTSVYGGPLYRYDLDADKVIAISRSHKTGETNVIGSGGFQYATPDGNVIYFQSGDQLTDNATVGGGIYRYEVSTDTLEQLTPDLGSKALFGIEGTVYGSETDSRIYFNSQRRFTPDAARGLAHLYVWERGDTGGAPGPGGPSKGTTRLITSIGDGGFARVSQNGRYALIQSRTSIDGASNKGKVAVYMYDAVKRDIACVSCRPNGTPNARDANLADEPESLTFGIFNPRNISNDGRVFFNSSDRLIPADQTFSQDVYEYYQGRVFLISAGQGDENRSYLADISDDGKHVFFISRTAYRPEDRDSDELDVYDAHTNGGFPLPKPAPPLCEGEACRTATSPKPEDAAPTTPNFSGAGNARPKRVKPKRHHPKKKHHKKKHKHAKKNHGGAGR